MQFDLIIRSLQRHAIAITQGAILYMEGQEKIENRCALFEH